LNSASIWTFDLVADAHGRARGRHAEADAELRALEHAVGREADAGVRVHRVAGVAAVEGGVEDDRLGHAVQGEVAGDLGGVGAGDLDLGRAEGDGRVLAASSQSLPVSSSLKPAGGLGRVSDLGSMVASTLEAEGLAGSNFSLASKSLNRAV
jgi:hypothetical protein